METQKATERVTNIILGEIKRLSDWKLTRQCHKAIKEVKSAIEAGDMEAAANACGEWKQDHKCGLINESLRQWQSLLWGTIEARYEV